MREEVRGKSSVKLSFTEESESDEEEDARLEGDNNAGTSFSSC